MALDLFEETLNLADALESRGIDYALVGGLAVAVHGAPRATTDIDLLVRPEDVERTLEAARTLGFDVEALPMRFRDGMEVRRVSRIAGEETLTLDLLLVDDNLEVVFEGRERLESERGPLTVASREGLIRMKGWANRPQDLADIERLRELDR